MRLLSWNVNSVRTIQKYHPWCDLPSFAAVLDKLDADIICLQETKVQRLNIERDIALPSGYWAFMSFSKGRKGFSGVATYVRSGCSVPVVDAFDGFSRLPFPIACASRTQLEAFDSEGRTCITDHGWFVLFNVYCPNETNAERLPFKMLFYRVLEEVARHFVSAGRQVVIAGDINACRSILDTCDPDRRKQEYGGDRFEMHPARVWLNKLSVDFVDTYRYFYPDKAGAYTCWNTLLNARPANYGDRIDYILMSKGLLDALQVATIESDIMGSDHCPVAVELQVPEVYAVKSIDQYDPPALCTKNYDEFSSRQKTIRDFFSNNCDKPSGHLNQAKSPKKLVMKRKAGDAGPNTLLNYFEKKPKNEKVTVDDAPVPSDDDDIVFIPDEKVSMNSQKEAWKSILGGKAKPAPLCKHGEPCKEYTVNKAGVNKGRKFYLCARGVGPVGKEKQLTEHRCNFFKWKAAK
eukprot:Partr_v1_DN26597_c1_g3_i3_m3676 putative Dna-(Apurinic or apyrimidinic site)